MESEVPDWQWAPPPRSRFTGHRVSSRYGARPIRTFRMGFWAWLAEIPMRRLAMLNKEWEEEGHV